MKSAFVKVRNLKKGVKECFGAVSHEYLKVLHCEVTDDSGAIKTCFNNWRSLLEYLDTLEEKGVVDPIELLLKYGLTATDIMEVLIHSIPHLKGASSINEWTCFFKEKEYIR